MADKKATMLFKSKRKIFCIGRNKTTSIGAALQSLGFKLGDQAKAELLMEDWAKRDFRRIVKYCKTADAFQDVPFSLDYTYGVLDYVFPGSKFILTIRNSAEEWYESLTRFDTKIVGKERLPTAVDLKTFAYREVGWLWRAHVLVYGIDESSLYDRNLYIRHYEAHCSRVVAYFQPRLDDLLVLNVGDAGAMDSLCSFLGVDCKGLSMPHLTKSREAA